jgi:hypothetical protein
VVAPKIEEIMCGTKRSHEDEGTKGKAVAVRPLDFDVLLKIKSNLLNKAFKDIGKKTKEESKGDLLGYGNFHDL